jgi:hypothetical protein
MSEMLIPTSQRNIKKVDWASVSKRFWHIKWPSSVGFNLAFATIMGTLYTLWVMGPKPLDPRNVDWLTFDGAQHEIAWELYRQDRNLHWPITFTDRIGYPEGESISLLDPNPLIAVILKPLSRFLSEPFQYEGPQVVLIYTLQFFFALLLFSRLFGPHAWVVILPAAFFLIAPPLTWRLVGHYAMANHWLILSSLLLFCSSQYGSPISIKQLIAYSAILTALAIAINPYLTLQVVAIIAATVITLVWRRRLTIGYMVGVVFIVGLTGIVVAASFGLIIPGGHGYDAGGYRAYSLNLLSPFDSYGLGGIIFKKLPLAFPEQYEGYNYLGLGVMLIGVVSIPVLFVRRRQYSWLTRQITLPIIGCCIALTLLALSTKITVGTRILIDLDPREKLTPYLAPLRASGRLFWTPYYVFLGTVLGATILCFRRGIAVIVLAVALLLQIIDINGLRRWVHSEVNNPSAYRSPLHSPIWSKLGGVYKNLIVMPAWQCNTGATPGGLNGYRIFGFLAMKQHLRINSYYAARYSEIKKQAQCGPDIEALSHKPLSPDSAYVVTYMLAQQIAQGPTGPGKCYNVDQFILCSPKTDFGLSPLVDPGELLKNPLADADFEESTLSAWPTFQNVTAVVSSARAHSGKHSLAETAGAGSVYQDLFGLTPGQTYQVVAWVAGTPGTTATAQISIYDPGANVATFSTPLTPQENWQMISHSARVSSKGILRIHLFRNPGLGIIFWDDVRVYRER